MMRVPLTILALVICLSSVANGADLLPLRISSDGRHLSQVGKDGSEIPFFYLADTAWAIFDVPNVTDVHIYLKDRAAKGYNVIQCSAVFFFDVKQPNANGDYAFLGATHSDPSQPNEKFFAHVDMVMDLITQYGFYIAVWPEWGRTFVHEQPIFNLTNAYGFGKYFGARYGNRTNMIYVMGGDTLFPLGNEIWIYRAMVEGLAQGVTRSPVRPAWNDTTNPIWKKMLISYHPTSGFSSSMEFESDPWMSINMVQSGWGNYQKIQSLVTGDFILTPVRPGFMGEGAYEKDIYTWTTDTWGTRLNGYWNILAGAFGHTYGANGIYQFQQQKTSDTDQWQVALAYPGSAQMQWIKKVVTSYPTYQALVPDIAGTVAVHNGSMADLTLVTCAFTPDRSFALVYTTSGWSFTVNMWTFPTPMAASWFDPRTGVFGAIEQVSNTATKVFTPPVPVPAKENDWVLVLTRK